jgi:hypothetical protein
VVPALLLLNRLSLLNNLLNLLNNLLPQKETRLQLRN